MKGAFNANPPKPRYNSTWDVSIVLRKLREWSPSDKLSLPLLTKKTLMLMLLCTGSRVQQVFSIKTISLIVEKGARVFSLDKLQKTDKLGHIKGVAKYVGYPVDRRLCVVRYIDAYLKATEKVRSTYDKFFLTFGGKTIKEASIDTIRRWVLDVLREAGINTNLYKAHSTRGAACSTAAGKGVPVDVILAAGGWASESTFSKLVSPSPNH